MFALGADWWIRNNHQPVESMVVISFYLRLLNRSNKFDNNAPSDEALRVMICIASPRSSCNTFSISTSLSPSFHSLRPEERENCSEGDIHLALPAPQRHGFNGIIAYWGGFVKGLQKNNRRCQTKRLTTTGNCGIILIATEQSVYFS